MIVWVTLVVMIGWEVFGVYVEGGFKVGFVTDTIGDIVWGLVGVLVSFKVLQLRAMRSAK